MGIYIYTYIVIMCIIIYHWLLLLYILSETDTQIYDILYTIFLVAYCTSNSVCSVFYSFCEFIKF
jgi:hypothetical protein